VATSPGAAIRAFGAVSQEFPFEAEVRKTADEKAQALSEKAGGDVRALADALDRFRVYGDEVSLADAEARARALAVQFPPPPPGSADASQLEQNVRALKA